MHYLIEPGSTLPDRFAYVIGGLCHYLGMMFTRDRSTGPLTLLIHARLRRLATRFAALVARIEAGTAGVVRARSVGSAARVASARTMPGGFGWLCRLMPEGNLFATYLEGQARTDVELAALLAVAPQAGRLLRPVLWMMGRPVPEILRLPKAPRPPVVRADPVAVPDPPYREQPKGSRYPSSVWPTEAELKRAGQRLAQVASRRRSTNRRPG